MRRRLPLRSLYPVDRLAGFRSVVSAITKIPLVRQKLDYVANLIDLRIVRKQSGVTVHRILTANRLRMGTPKGTRNNVLRVNRWFARQGVL
jgi:hypothetical protein